MRSNIIDLAQNYYRSPADHEDLVDSKSPVPKITSDIMEALSNDDHSVSEHGVLTADIRKAARFTLEQIIFSAGGDFYRVLGLDRDATADSIRSHYDQLQIIFFHQDDVDNWNNDYAMRINRAYRTLRDPEKRRAYDEQLDKPDSERKQRTSALSQAPEHGPGRPGSAASSYIANSVHRAFSSHDDHSSPADDRQTAMGQDKSLDPLPVPLPTGIHKREEDVHRHRPLVSLLKDRTSLALLSGVIIILSISIILLPPVIRDFQTENPGMTIGSGDVEPASLHGQVVRAPTVDDSEDLSLAPDHQAPTESAGATAGPEIDDLPPPLDPPDLAPDATIPSMGTTDPEPDLVSESVTPRQAATTPPEVMAPALPATPSLPPAPVIDVSPARLVVTTGELDSLTDTFTNAYRSGNLELMMGLFTEDARTNEREGRSVIRSDYQELFDATESREFIIRGMRWRQGRDGGVSGEGTFEVNIRFKDDGTTSALTGKIMLHVEKKSQGAVITELRHAYH